MMNGRARQAAIFGAGQGKCWQNVWRQICVFLWNLGGLTRKVTIYIETVTTMGSAALAATGPPRRTSARS